MLEGNGAKVSWGGLRALLEIHPTIIDELKDEQAQTERYWINCFLTGFDIVQHRSMNAAAKSRQISCQCIQQELKKLQLSACTQPFVEWARQKPTLFSKLVARFGLEQWPAVGDPFGNVYETRGETSEALQPLVVHPDVAVLLSHRLGTLREEITTERERRRKIEQDLMQQELDNLEKVMQTLEGDLEPEEKPLTSLEITEMAQAHQNLLQRRIEELSFTTRTYNRLKKANIQTVGELVETSEEELLNIRSAGPKTVNEVQDKLAQYGLVLKQKEKRSRIRIKEVESSATISPDDMPEAGRDILEQK